MSDPFSLQSVNFEQLKQLPRSPGVYFVICRNPAKLLYIGIAEKSLHERWKGHHRIEELRIINEVTHLEISYDLSFPKNDLESVELDLIKKLNPIFNWKKVSIKKARNNSIKKPVQSFRFDIEEIKERDVKHLKYWAVKRLNEARKSMSYHPPSEPQAAKDLAEVYSNMVLPPFPALESKNAEGLEKEIENWLEKIKEEESVVKNSIKRIKDRYGLQYLYDECFQEYKAVADYISREILREIQAILKFQRSLDLRKACMTEEEIRLEVQERIAESISSISFPSSMDVGFDQTLSVHVDGPVEIEGEKNMHTNGRFNYAK